MDRFVVLTGGPGGGKTTLLAALAARGYAVTTEAGRALVRAGVGAGDPAAFAEAVLEWERRSYAWALSQRGVVLFDRGMPDVAGSWLAMRGEVPPHVEAAIEECRYRSPVLAAPPWREIYVHDAERTHSWETAVATYEAMVDAYGRYGYEVVDLPLVPVEERVAFVLDFLS
ncbi:MAG TPA: AAA family ATPase [Frankiaceae bacterium]|jgi:predicted ATPase|nr:AAA family ATPase [Frankiaceae bacterium]